MSWIMILCDAAANETQQWMIKNVEIFSSVDDTFKSTFKFMDRALNLKRDTSNRPSRLETLSRLLQPHLVTSAEPMEKSLSTSYERYTVVPLNFIKCARN